MRLNDEKYHVHLMQEKKTDRPVAIYTQSCRTGGYSHKILVELFNVLSIQIIDVRQNGEKCRCSPNNDYGNNDVGAPTKFCLESMLRDRFYDRCVGELFNLVSLDRTYHDSVKQALPKPGITPYSRGRGVQK